jgi:Na+:H+ antiporter, NhaA family
LLCTIASLLIANSVWGEGYIAFWHRSADLSFSRISLNYSIEHWINDGLMAIFFLLVGLEIERELYIGELAGIKNAMLPVAAAIGGMAVPAFIYFLFTNGTAGQSGVGIPMATDIAFALGMLSLLGSRVPASIKIFLTALAIIDDLGAILVIAIFYNTGVSWNFLSAALAIFILLFIMGKKGINNLWFYLIPGVVMWYCMMQSGVHATITGVLLAFAIPFGKKGGSHPSERLQHFLHKPVAFFILPIFALANTGILISNQWVTDMISKTSLGVIVGLVIGKPLGILTASFLVIKSGLAKLPQGVHWKHIFGVSLLGGIGFTMSIFIANLAFTDLEMIRAAKISILAASAIACIAGLFVLYKIKIPEKVED